MIAEVHTNHPQTLMASKQYTSDSSIGQRLLEVQRIKLEIDRLTEQLDEHKAYLLGHAIRNDYESLHCEAIAVSRRERPCWTYSDAVKDAEAKLKARKAREQDKGIAVNKPSEHLVITFSAKIALLSKTEA